MDLLKQLNINETTVNRNTDLPDGVAIYKLIDYLETINPEESTFLYDVNLEPLLDYFFESGFTENQILEFDKSMYGQFIEITYYKDIEIYVLEFGVR